MMNDELTAIRADLDRRASWQRMSSMEFIRNVSSSQVNDLNRRLIRAVPVLVDEVERLRTELASREPQTVIVNEQWKGNVSDDR